MSRIGIISDTHGLLRPQASAALESCDHILHAGDIGKPEVLESLQNIAAVTAIRGNVDHWASDLPDTASVKLAGTHYYLLHDLNTLAIDPKQHDIDVVVSGHSHKPSQLDRDGIIYLNPGSAGQRRFRLPVTLAIASDTDAGLQIEILDLL